ncbi:uncharacterized protein LOC116289424 [Actinia tenebrosa]|uniref:Uncharacterized protein LOC116289424 n=1 Tax=Actinia tenebrosa TaxID=6105 RepID=A0A6P8HHW1_ACTTE|nr:uncharacterized protein LOC116289424 [Actinia tenebrosa]
MKASKASRHALFLILLVLGQEFSVAFRVAPQSKSLQKREIRKNSLEERSRQKRAWGFVLLAVTLGVSAAGVGFEIYNKVKGCCGTFPDACKYAREIEAFRKTLDNKTNEVDKLFLRAKNLKEDVIQANYRINEMWIDLLAIGRYQEDIIQSLTPETVKKFNTKWAEIEEQLKNGNRTVQGWSYEQIDLQYKSYLDSASTVLGGMSGFISNTLSAVYTVAMYYYKVNTLNKMINQLGTGNSYRLLVNARHTKAARTMGLNDVGLNKFIKETAVAKFNSKFAVKYTFFYNAYYVASSFLSIGFDIWRAVQSVLACKEKRDKTRELRDTWRVADQEMDKIKKNAIEYYNLLKNKGWEYVEGNLTDANLIKSLDKLKNMVNSSRPQTENLKKANTKIGNFISQINTSIDDYDATHNLQAGLIEGLMTVKTLLACSAARTKFLYYASEQCKQGHKSLQAIYESGKTSFLVSGVNCVTSVGIPDAVTWQEMEDMIAARATKEKYQKDCILNNSDKKEHACWLRGQGYDNKVIENKMALNIAQVKFFTTNCPQTLSPAQISQICFFRSLGVFDATIQAKFFPHINLSIIQAVTCP